MLDRKLGPDRVYRPCAKGKEHAMGEILKSVIAVIGTDIGKNSFHVVGLDG